MNNYLKWFEKMTITGRAVPAEPVQYVPEFKKWVSVKEIRQMKQIELPATFFPATIVYLMDNGFIDVCGFDGNEVYNKKISIENMCKEEDKLIASIGEYLSKL